MARGRSGSAWLRLAWLAAALATVTAAALTWQAPAGASAWSGAAPAAGRQAALAGVSCPRSARCIAVGDRTTVHGQNPLAEQWNGSSWKVQPIPDPQASEASLVSVSCPTSTDCTAVGAEASSRNRRGPLAEQWNGHRWRITQAGDPPGVKLGNLAGVSCARTNDCVAVGTSQTTSRFLALAEKWNGHSWRVLKAAKVSRSALLADVHCTKGFCLAVGQIENSAHTLIPAAEIMTGTTWKLLSAQSPAGTNFSILDGIWCTNPKFCLAVGQSEGATDTAIAERYSGTSWTLQPLSASNDILSGISCIRQSACMAVGSGPTRPVSQRWNGSAWNSVPTAHISGTPFAGLGQVSCPTATRCIAVGARTNGSPLANGTSLAEEWNGSSWRVLRTVNP
jgi:hypothetical protein